MLLLMWITRALALKVVVQVVMHMCVCVCVCMSQRVVAAVLLVAH